MIGSRPREVSGLRRITALFVAVGSLVLAASPSGQQDGSSAQSGGGTSPIRLAPTVHPQVPADLSAMWLATAQAPTALGPVLASFVRGVRLLEEQDNAGAALPLVSSNALAATPLSDYARYYTGRALLKLARYDAADAVFGALASRNIEGHLPEDAAFGQADAREGRKDFAGAVDVYDALVQRRLAQPHAAWFKLGLASDRAGNRARAIEALRRVYYDYPLTQEADDAGAELSRLGASMDASLATREFARAEALFKAKRWKPARESYERARSYAEGADRGVLDVHMAACDVSLKQARAAREALGPYLDGPLAEEAGYYYITATRVLGLKDDHERLAREFVTAHPASPWADEVLNGLASAFIIDDDDERAVVVFREMLERYPSGRFAERAAWKAGWWAYRHGQFDEAGQIFDRGAAAFPRSDYRPPWLYWSGRAAEQAGTRATALARYSLAATDYYNSYYGRLSVRRLAQLGAPAVMPSVHRTPAQEPGATVPTAQRIALLIATGLNREALGELEYAQRMWGDSPQVQATIALAQNRLGNVRAGINGMKRAYPQYLSAGGEALPFEILRVIFPLEFWPLLQKYSAARDLDPFLVAALVAQESNFDPKVQSSARAVGLMQVLPSTGRYYARVIGIRPFSSRRLIDPDVNVRIGTSIFANTIKRFGGVHFALAAYNAGDSRVAAWQREKPGLPQDEFIDDIPFPETQNYVKRILGTAEDYRRLYGSGAQQ